MSSLQEVPSRMRASVLESAHHLVVREVDTPVLASDQVLVRIAAVGVCGSDVHYFHEGRIGDFVVDAPLILGHEASGTIVAVGTEVSADRIGERVSIEPQRACRICTQCKRGRYNLCPSIEFYATPPIHGAFAEFAVIQADYAFAIPDSVSLEAASLFEPLSVAIWAHKKALTQPGSRVLIAGAGPVGILLAQVARAYGATEVIVSDLAAARRDRALEFGATSVIDPTVVSADEVPEVDAFIDASGAPSAIRAGILALAPAGIAVLVGMGADDVSLPVSRIQGRELLVTGVFRYANTWPLAIELVASGAVDLESLVTSTFSLDRVEEAFEATRDPNTLKALITP
ncbi:NAD(P)-dependent alcohol dehydrogenase [Salinibacterium sp. UTAS2018]|uniref:NAD(P)-dependent alcohol dehydrogenase n=1 Tax=Salinibacterium sp. UTAS2018 TaxID=2508880 RepID=UPI0010094246|nr:NAD(P)-dependent alcohol dehydrogenase [Salinibacterium sp. UTAS2018]QAV69663.1 NAD(P)-dependent alcohol dehydrogenase [Salinibacterium sp. UTAS2018]